MSFNDFTPKQSNPQDENRITFTETVHDDGRIEVSWITKYPRDWKRLLELVKQGIPQNARTYQKERKSWLIAASYRNEYENIKQAVLTEDIEVVGEIDEQLNDNVLASLLQTRITDLPVSMRGRAIFAIKAVLGIIDAPVEYCISEGMFAAWHEGSQTWLFENGRYSSTSPDERDTRSITKAYTRLKIAIEQLPDALQWLDGERPDNWKVEFRHNMLQKYHYRCYVCDTRPANLSRLHMHRVIPGRLDGMYVEENVVIVCTGCHKRVEGLPWEHLHTMHSALMGDQS